MGRSTLDEVTWVFPGGRLASERLRSSLFNVAPSVSTDVD